MKKNHMKVLLLLLILTIGFICWQQFGVKSLHPETIQSFILSFGWWAPFFYILFYTIRPLIFFPAILLSLTGGLTFGPWWGTFYDLIGASLGAYLAFGLARFLGRDAISLWLGQKTQTWDELAGENGFKTIFFLRLIPLIPFDMVNYGAGLMKIRFRDYALATTIGILPGAFAYNFLGNSIHHIFSVTFYLAIALVIFLLILPSLYKKYKKKGLQLEYDQSQHRSG